VAYSRKEGGAAVAQHPFLKSIRPVNLLSFGPNTEAIELRPLNILIGANGSGKSNLIEILGLLNRLPDKDPWSTVIQTGGASEWVWKGKNTAGRMPSLFVTTAKKDINFAEMFGEPLSEEKKSLFYSIVLQGLGGGFGVEREHFREFDEGEDPTLASMGAFERDSRAVLTSGVGWPDEGPKLPLSRSVLSVLAAEPSIATQWPRLVEFAKQLERFAFYRDWIFGSGSKIRSLQPVGLDSYRLAGDSINLAQVLKALRDRGGQTIFERLMGLLRTFYEPIKDVDTELVGTHLRVMIKEEGLSSRTPAERLSDGTLRWLMLLVILLDPSPPPVICIEEPELGLHPDILPTLADLLIEASTRTQLIITTHSRSFIDSFTDTPEAVCVCEKVEGSTVIQRLDKDRLKDWLEEYSLGKVWTRGEIGGNRW
jgi:predicted ATPase